MIYVLCKDRTDYLLPFSTLEKAQEMVRKSHSSVGIPVGDIVWEHRDDAGENMGYWETTFLTEVFGQKYLVSYTIWPSTLDRYY